MMGSKAFESPLISHARMRAIYRALVETRLLGARVGKRNAFAKGLEACWVGTAIDLKSGDLTSESTPNPLLQHILRVGTREAARAAKQSDLSKTLHPLGPQHQPFPGSTFERLLTAVGQAIALQSAGTGAVVMAYVSQSDLKPREWIRIFAAARPDLPLILVALPGGKAKVDLENAVRTAAASAPIPVIPVDAGDAVALYRVTQESIGRARAEGGVAVIECVPLGVDPIKLMRTQLIQKRICTETWATGVETNFKKLLHKP